MPGTDLGTLFASIDLASHLVPGTDLGTLFASIDLASHLVPGTGLGLLFASIAWRRTRCLAPIRARTDSGSLFASIRPGVALGAWHRFGHPVC